MTQFTKSPVTSTEGNSSPPKSKAFRSILRSPIIWLLVMLLSVDVFITIVKPLRFISISGLMLKDQDIIGQRVDSLLSPQASYNTLVLGDSMTEHAAVNADVKAGLASLDTNTRFTYTDSRYFEQQLKDKLGLNARLGVMGEAGGIIAGNELLLNKVLEHRKPKLVLLLVGPRGFIDDSTSLELYPMQCYMKNRFKTASSDTSTKGIVESMLSNFWRYYAIRSDYATICNIIVCNALDRKATLYAAMAEEKEKPKNKLSMSFSPFPQKYDPERKLNQAETKFVTDFYISVYGHQSQTRWQLNLKSFENMLATLQKNGIPSIVISMPISADNRRLARPTFLSDYNNTLISVCQRYRSKLIYMLDDPRFTATDYQDGVHLTGAGSMKFWQYLADEIKGNSSLSEPFKQALN